MKGTNHHVLGVGGAGPLDRHHPSSNVTLNHHILRNSLPPYHHLNKVSTFPSIGVILTPLPLTPCSSLQQVF